MNAVAQSPVPGELMRLVADGLEARNYRCEYSPGGESGWISACCAGARCYLLVCDDGLAEWEFVPCAASAADPELTAGVAVFLLTGKDGGCPPGNRCRTRGLSFKGIAGTELRARGFHVSLEVYEDRGAFTVESEILVTSPAGDSDASVRITDEGGIFWECGHACAVTAVPGMPEYGAVVADPAGLADSIVRTVTHAVSLLPGMAGASADA